MSVFSKIFGRILSRDGIGKPFTAQKRQFFVSSVLKSGHGSDNTFKITASRFTWHQFKDKINFYVLLGAIPCGLVVMYCNIFIGPAQLQPIPEGYTPKHWEYFPHPITRFIARYIWPSPQQNYEKQMHWLFEEDEKRRIRILEAEIRDKMAANRDYQSYYYRPITAKYIRLYKDITEEYIDREGFRKHD